MQVTQNIKLNIYQTSEYLHVSAKQADDNSRFLRITFTDGKNDLPVPSSAIVSLRALKPDKTSILDSGVVNEDGTVTVELTDQVLAVEGIVRADVMTSQGGEILSTATFLIRVGAVPIGTEVVSSNEFLQLVELYEEISELMPVDTDNIVDGAVTTPKLADDAVTSGKIADGAVGTDNLADGAVTNAKIAEGTITGNKFVPALPITEVKATTSGAKYEQSVTTKLGVTHTALLVTSDHYQNALGAVAFSTTATYAVGDYVVYNKKIYKCINAHSGAWADADFEETKVLPRLDDVEENVTTINSEINEVVESFTTLKPYLVKENAYITTSGTYTAYEGVNTYHIPLQTLDICHVSWDVNFWGDFPVGSIFTVKKSDDTYERVAGYKKYGAFYSSGKECIICAIENVTDVFIVAPNNNNIVIAVNEPSIRLANDITSAKVLSETNTIHTNYYIASASFNYFNSPYGSYFIKMSQGDKLIINKTLTGVSGVGFIAVADGTSTNITAREYTASTDCIFCAFDKTDVLGDFTFIPYDSLKIASKDIIGDIGKSPFNGLDGVAFGTSLTYLSLVSNGYLTKLSELSGITFDNQGIGSATIRGDILTRIKGYTSYSVKRLCILEGFVNDWYGNVPLGDYTDTTENTACGCVRSAINYIYSQNPNITMFLILDHYGRNNSGINCSTTHENGSGLTQYEYYEAIAKVAESLGVPAIKEYEVSQISENTPQYLADNIHLNAKGAIQSAYAIWSQMKQYYPNQL